jgi:hypothetical protein
MSTNKRISGDYNLETISGNVGITSDVVITGNLTVTGTSTEITSTDTAITDRVITLNDGETGAGVTGGTSGLQIDRGTETDARIVFDESDDMWKIDSGSGSLVAIATSSGGGIVVAPNGSGELQIDGTAIRVENSSAPSAETGYNKLYAGTVSSGGSGLFFVNDDASDELVSKSKAIVYGIIF